MYYFPMEGLNDTIIEELAEINPLFVDGFVLCEGESAVILLIKYKDLQKISDGLAELLVARIGYLFTEFKSSEIYKSYLQRHDLGVE